MSEGEKKKSRKTLILQDLSLFDLILSLRFSGERGIRTPGTVARTPHFECGPIDHSGISPVYSARKNLPFGTANIDIFFVSRHFRAKIFSSGREKAAISGSFRAFPK